MVSRPKLRVVIWLSGVLLCLAGVALIPRVRDFVRLAWNRHPSCPLTGIPSRPALAVDLEEGDRIAEESEVAQSQPGFDLVKTRYGTYWVPTDNASALGGVLAEERRDPYSFQSCRVRAGDVVLDCGANVGVFTRRALNRGARLVVAIEPGPDNVECLRRNFAPEIQAGRVLVYSKGVWDQDSWLELWGQGKGSAGYSVVMKEGADSRSVRVPLTTIDKLVAGLKLDRVDFIKMDVEGAERQALSGAAGTLRRFRPRMAISVEHLGADVDDLPKLVARFVPDLKVRCGPCIWLKNTNMDRFQPETLFFGE
jgi:FkbM family methyltransferase